MVLEYLRKLGHAPAEPLKEMQTWLEWYQGNVKEVHQYTVYNGQKLVGCKRDSMSMAKQACADWASLILSEKTEITTPDAGLKALLDETLKRNGFAFRANQLIEITWALGTGALVEYLDNQSRIVVDYVRGDCIYPLDWDNGDITSCAFASVRQIGGKKTFYVAIHEQTPSGYLIRNRLIDAETGKELELPQGLVPEIDTRSNIPRYQIIQPNLVNNVSFDSPFGISIFANAIGRLKKVDLIFDSGNNEFSLGRKRIIVPLSMAQIAVGEANQRPVFDPRDVAFYALNVTGAAGDAQKPIDLTGELRIDEHSKGLQDALNYLSDGVGLGTDRYEYTRGGGVKTATEVISEKSTLYQNLQRHKLPVEAAILGMCRAIASMTGHNPDAEISVNFDDSIIQDEAAVRQQALLEYQAGLIDEVEYFIETRGLEPESAAKLVAEMSARREQIDDSGDDISAEQPEDDTMEE